MLMVQDMDVHCIIVSTFYLFENFHNKIGKKKIINPRPWVLTFREQWCFWFREQCAPWGVTGVLSLVSESPEVPGPQRPGGSAGIEIAEPGMRQPQEQQAGAP